MISKKIISTPIPQIKIKERNPEKKRKGGKNRKS